MIIALLAGLDAGLDIQSVANHSCSCVFDARSLSHIPPFMWFLEVPECFVPGWRVSVQTPDVCHLLDSAAFIQKYNVCLYDICKFTFNSKWWSICRRSVLSFVARSPETRTQWLQDFSPLGIANYMLRVREKETPADTLAHGRAADEVVCPLISHWSARRKMKGWSAVCWSVVSRTREPRRQTHRRMGLVINEMARARTVIFYLY